MIYKLKLLNNSKFFLPTRILVKKISNFTMAKSKYEYVKEFELEDKILPNSWFVVRIDGKGFHKFADVHKFIKPNDENGLNLMNFAAITVMNDFRDVILSYGQSDEYSFVFQRKTCLYNRRSAKIMTNLNSLFTSAYVYHWSKFFPDKKLKYPPCFDARVVLYPTDQNLRDYLSWRQADVHVNNLYNTIFWNLVLNGNLTNVQAEEKLRGSLSADKNEMLFTQFGINYNKELAMFRKGTILLRKKIEVLGSEAKRKLIVPVYDDLIQDKFWTKHSELLGKKDTEIYRFDGPIPLLVTKQLEE